MKPLDHSTNPRRRTNVDVLIGENLRRIRLRKNISQTDLARALNLTFQQIQKYESGTNRIALSRVIEIAGLLGVRVSDFTAGIELGSPVPFPPRRRHPEFDDVVAKVSSKQRVALLRLAEAMAGEDA